MLTEHQAKRLAEAGLYVTTTTWILLRIIQGCHFYRAFEDRLESIGNVRKTNVTVCSGGIIGMGEQLEDRAGMLVALRPWIPSRILFQNTIGAGFRDTHGDIEPVSIWGMARMLATTRIITPETQVSLSAGRTEMSQ